jgi:hypothetical protein
VTTNATPARGIPGEKKWSTPRWYRVQRLAIWAASLLFFVIAQGTLRRAVATLNTIGKDAAPSIIAAQEINSALADLDANAANYMLGNRTNAIAAMQTFETRRLQTTRRIVDAAENVTYGEEEKKPILTMVENLGRYLELFGEARFRHDAGDQVGALTAYRNATQLMHDVILPAADELDRANKRYMDAHYEEQRRADQSAEALAAMAGVILGGVLLWGQIFLFKRTRRVVNVPLAVSTLLTFGYTVYAISTFGQANTDLKIAKEDAFESIHALWRARAIAFDANGDESRFLLDKERAAQHEKVFRDRVALLTTTPSPSQADVSLLQRGNAPTFKGLFADELRNGTFDGERAAAVLMVQQFARYYAIDVRIRSLEKAGQHQEAIQLCIGSGANESNAVFAGFDEALEKVIAINKREFDHTIDEGGHALKVAEYVNPVITIAIALLALIGYRPRLREYEA